VLSQPIDTDLSKEIATLMAQTNPHLQPVEAYLKDPSPANTASIVELLGLSATSTPEEIKTGCLEFITPVYEGAKAIASGISPSLKSKILGNSSEMISNYLQGEKINVERLLACFENRSQSPVVAQEITYIQNKIREEASIPDSTWIERFIYCVSGSRAMSPNFKIIVNGSSDEAVRVHTCFNTIDLPITHTASHIDDPSLSDEARFIRNLEITMSQTNYGFS
jgi:hypothetical protein